MFVKSRETGEFDFGFLLSNYHWESCTKAIQHNHNLTTTRNLANCLAHLKLVIHINNIDIFLTDAYHDMH